MQQFVHIGRTCKTERNMMMTSQGLTCRDYESGVLSQCRLLVKHNPLTCTVFLVQQFDHIGRTCKTNANPSLTSGWTVNLWYWYCMCTRHQPSLTSILFLTKQSRSLDKAPLSHQGSRSGNHSRNNEKADVIGRVVVEPSVDTGLS